jgi:hypothetical protein
MWHGGEIYFLSSTDNLRVCGNQKERLTFSLEGSLAARQFPCGLQGALHRVALSINLGTTRAGATKFSINKRDKKKDRQAIL